MADYFLHTKPYNKVPTWDMLCKMLYPTDKHLVFINANGNAGNGNIHLELYNKTEEQQHLVSRCKINIEFTESNPIQKFWVHCPQNSNIGYFKVWGTGDYSNDNLVPIISMFSALEPTDGTYGLDDGNNVTNYQGTTYKEDTTLATCIFDTSNPGNTTHASGLLYETEYVLKSSTSLFEPLRYIAIEFNV